MRKKLQPAKAKDKPKDKDEAPPPPPPPDPESETPPLGAYVLEEIVRHIVQAYTPEEVLRELATAYAIQGERGRRLAERLSVAKTALYIREEG